MNITPQAPTLSIPTAVNPQTDSLRRENNIREVIAKPAAASQSAAEKGVASDKERGRTPAQNNESVDFENIRKQAELAAKTISGDSDRQNDADEQSSAQKYLSQISAEEADTENDQSTEQVDKAAEQESIKAFADQKVINELKLRDKEVRSHELAHASVGGASTGAPSYSFEVGPDGKKYAVSGEVSVDLSRVDGNPKATIAKMQKVHAAALAPANPSIQDIRVAASAANIILQAQSELAALASEGTEKANKSSVSISERGVFRQDGDESSDSDDFDSLVNRTLESQEKISPSRDISVDERALRIEDYYSGIIQAYEKPSSSNFQLTA